MPTAAEQFDLPTRPATKEEAQMDIHTITSVGTPPRSRAGSRHEHLFSPTSITVIPQTPPESLSGSPSIQGHGKSGKEVLDVPYSSIYKEYRLYSASGYGIAQQQSMLLGSPAKRCTTNTGFSTNNLT